METSIKNLTKEEKENVLLVLNEFSEEYKENKKNITGLITAVKELSSKITALPDKTESLNTSSAEVAEVKDILENGIEKIATSVQRISFPVNELYQLSANLDKTTYLLQYPTPQKVVQQHHISKISWVAAGLLLVRNRVC